jgi:D-alanyl-D-alanine carboxypeptidase
MSSKNKKIIFAIFPIIVGVFLANLIFANFPYVKLENNIVDIPNSQNAAVVNAPALDISAKQKYFYFNKDDEAKLRLSAESYIVGDLNTGEVILSKNAENKYPIASVSKMMTALVADQIAEKDETTKVSAEALKTYGTNGGLYKGEQIKVKDLIYPLLLQSSNDAAEVIARHFERDTFMKKMNQQADILKMINTFYDDPSGLSNKNQSTVSDLFKLTGYIYKNQKHLLDISKTRSYNTKKHSWFSTNQFLRNSNYIGGKSGFTNPAKQTVVSVFNLPLGRDSSRPIGIVLLRSNDRAKDVNNILKYLNKNVYYGGEADAYSDWIKEKLNIPSIKDPDYVTLSFLGDIMLDRGVRASVNKNFSGDYSKLFDKMDVLEKSDIVFANLEGPASDQGKDLRNLYSFRMDPNAIPALKGANFSILSVANNHAGDWGPDAFSDTLSRLTENEILYTGGGYSNEIEKPTIIEKYDMKIGFLGFSDVGPQNLKPTLEKQGILLANNPRIKEIISNASKEVDYLIVSFHFGDEYKTTNNKRQQTLARAPLCKSPLPSAKTTGLSQSRGPFP